MYSSVGDARKLSAVSARVHTRALFLYCKMNERPNDEISSSQLVSDVVHACGRVHVDVVRFSKLVLSRGRFVGNVETSG